MTTMPISNDSLYPLRTRICMLLSIDPLSDDETLYRSLSTYALDATEPIRINLCNMLELDYCTDKDMDIYHAIAMLYAEIDVLRNVLKERDIELPEIMLKSDIDKIFPTSHSSSVSTDSHLTPFARAHLAVISDNPTPDDWKLFESLKQRDLSSRETSGKNEMEGKNA